MSTSTVSGGGVAVIFSARARFDIDRPSCLITGAVTAGEFAIFAYDFTRSWLNRLPW